MRGDHQDYLKWTAERPKIGGRGMATKKKNVVSAALEGKWNASEVPMSRPQGGSWL